MSKEQYYDVCPDCGATLDPGEICDCSKKHERYLERSARLLMENSIYGLGLFQTKIPEVDEVETKNSSPRFELTFINGKLYSMDIVAPERDGNDFPTVDQLYIGCDFSKNGDTPCIAICRGKEMLNVIHGQRAVELYNELLRPDFVSKVFNTKDTNVEEMSIGQIIYCPRDKRIGILAKDLGKINGEDAILVHLPDGEEVHYHKKDWRPYKLWDPVWLRRNSNE